MNGTNQGLPGSGAGGDGGFENQIDSLLQLVTARARGQVGSEEVENAISQLLQQQQQQTTHQPPTGTGPSAAPATASTRVSEKAVVEDVDDYDDLEDDTSNRKPPADGGSRGTKRRRSSSGNNDDDNNNNEGGGGTEGSGAEIDQSKQWDELDAIPLGRQGAKMMVTFGDGRNPRPKTVEAALLVSWCKKSSFKWKGALSPTCVYIAIWCNVLGSYLFIVSYANRNVPLSHFQWQFLVCQTGCPSPNTVRSPRCPGPPKEAQG